MQQGYYMAIKSICILLLVGALIIPCLDHPNPPAQFLVSSIPKRATLPCSGATWGLELGSGVKRDGPKGAERWRTKKIE